MAWSSRNFRSIISRLLVCLEFLKDIDFLILTITQSSETRIMNIYNVLVFDLSPKVMLRS